LLREINSAADRPSGVKDAVMDHDRDAVMGARDL
jgi:hypothetical protein